MTEPQRPESPSSPSPPTPSAAEGHAGGGALPQARVVRRGRPSLVWLLPVIALAVGGWLVVKTLAEQGPSVSIDFENAAGLNAGKTKVKYKDVDIGTVTRIDVSTDLDHVTVTADLRQGSEEFLAEDTRFWVSRPRITASQVSGLETLLSGAFVALDPGSSRKQSRHFQGLARPPVITTDAPGRRFRLRADTLGSLNPGTPVYYRRIQVGQVIDYTLDDDGGAVTVDVFINSPHDKLVHTNTRFWNASGIDLELSANGVRLDTQSLVSVLVGGVAFDTPADLEATDTVAPADQFFPLYANRSAANKQVYLHKERYLMIFNGSVRGLNVGAPVSLRGIRIGQVMDIELDFDKQQLDFRIPVLVEVEPERIGFPEPQSADDQKDARVLRQLVQRGLRAQLKTGNLLTGALYIELDFHSDAAPAKLTQRQGYSVVPTLPTPLEAATNKITALLDKVNALPIEGIGEDLQAAVGDARELLGSAELRTAVDELSAVLSEARGVTAQLNSELAPKLDAVLGSLQGTLEDASRTLNNTNELIGPDAPMSVEAVRTMREVSAAARSLRVMADYLERHPEALIQGKGGGR
ncbi:mammalian cell entry protein [Thiohalocapsa halophila]|uniref:Mammalian cell entry protein n=1 Tax=Thiohalocapsa halophila TaxID=69359 RepID=A0ABS1CIR9_9GAMM|nr:MlaD family protein [Thiohalocapsa halophila]MBK1631807.1 mammalian cell entry protein [Thiohalocapsa halophila]